MPVKERRLKLLLLFLLGAPSTRADAGFQSEGTGITASLQQIFDVSLNQKTKGTVSSLVKDGMIEKLEQAAQQEGAQQKGSLYRLTPKGLNSLALEFPYFRFLFSDWDGLWRVISYEIPEKQRKIRDRLRREMRGWGLGPWHRSFWITPHPIMANLRDLVYGREEEKYVQAFEATHVFGQREVLVEKVWGQSSLEDSYRKLFKSWHETLSKDLTNEEKMREIVAGYVSLLRDDPGLPSSLLGRKWIGFESWDIFREVRTILLR